MKKRALALVLALAMALGAVAFAGAEDSSRSWDIPFTDVSATAWYHDAVVWAYESGVTTGATATTFGPYENCTRGQVVTFLWRAMGQPEPATGRDPFTDVAPDMYYYKPVLWAVENNVTTGTSADKFSPAEPCTNSQIVTFLWRAVGRPTVEVKGTQAEVYNETDYDRMAVAWAEVNELLKYDGRWFYRNSRSERRQIVYYMYVVRDMLNAKPPSGTPQAASDGIVSVRAADIPTPEEGKATAYIDGVKYELKAVKSGDMSAPTMKLYFPEKGSFREPTITVDLGFGVNDNKGETFGKSYTLWHWMWRTEDEYDDGYGNRYGHSSYGTLHTPVYDPSNQSPSVFEIEMTSEDKDGVIHEIVIKARCTVSGLVSNYVPGAPSSGGSSGSGLMGSTTCSSCHGNGRCPTTCKNGRIYYPTYGTKDRGYTLCPICNGTGKCVKCGGSGKGN